MGRPALKKIAVEYITTHHGISQRRACRLIKQTRSSQFYTSRKDRRDDLRSRMREIAHTRVRYGYRRIHVVLRREGWRLGRDQAYRLYTQEQLQLRSKLPKKRKMAVLRRERVQPKRPNDAWCMDFVSDELSTGVKFRILTVVDVHTREALAVEAGSRLKGEHVVDVLNRLVAQRGSPRHVFVDNGSEFTGRLMDMWAYHHGVRIDFSRPGKPTDNSFIETFNGSLRDECLNVHWFDQLGQAKGILEAWRRDYNESRPHSSLNDLTPAEYARKIKHLEQIQSFATAEN
jgi:putative transposase